MTSGDAVREAFRLYAEDNYANDYGLGWTPDDQPYVDCDGMRSFLHEEWELWQSAHRAGKVAGMREAAEVCAEQAGQFYDHGAANSADGAKTCVGLINALAAKEEA